MTIPSWVNMLKKRYLILITAHAVLHGLTPIEVLQGKRYNKEMQNNLLNIAKQTRIFENQKMKCCFGSF